MNAHRDSICHHPMNLHAVDRFSPSWLMSSTADKLLLVVGRWPPFYTLHLHGKMAAPSCPPATQEDGHPFTPSTCTGRRPPLHTLHLHRKMAAPSHPPPAQEDGCPFILSSCPHTPPASRIWIALLERKTLLPTNHWNKLSQEWTDSSGRRGWESLLGRQNSSSYDNLLHKLLSLWLWEGI